MLKGIRELHPLFLSECLVEAWCKKKPFSGWNSEDLFTQKGVIGNKKKHIMCISILEGLRIQVASIVIKRNIMDKDNPYKW